MKHAALFALLLSSTLTHSGALNPCAVQVYVGKGNAITVRVPCVNKEDIAEVVSTFFGRGDDQVAARFRKLLKESQDVSLTITSKENP